MKEKEPFAIQAAKFSLWMPLIAILLNLLARASAVSASGRAAIGFISLALYPVALIFGVAALFGMRKHGRKGILVRGILGVTINVLIIALAVASIPMSQRLARKRASQASLRPFTFTQLPDFIPYPEGAETSPHVLYSFIKNDLNDPQGNIILIIEDLGGRIVKEDMSKVVIGKDNIRLLRENWKTYEIDVFEIRETVGEATILTYNAQIPVLPRAVQVKVIGLSGIQEELQATLREALRSIDGSTNW